MASFNSFDRKSQYRAVILYHAEEQRVIAEKSKTDLDQSGRFLEPVVTAIEARSD
ncbi:MULTISPECIES: peptide-methionine (S)-S-oxide reductase [Paenibacillus]|uniref:peptide-methionine (S)-S-oxide reductase n=1 Tax=Paenibacillus TaxID=44249 RepID=UPI0009FAFD3E|nr:peptide-methionine (S)-S-oxide reductase [Paenibacillus amylolyticus]